MIQGNEITHAEPCFSPVVFTNEMPSIKGIDDALRARLRVLPWDNAWTQPRWEKWGRRKLAEGPAFYEGVLSWLIDGWPLAADGEFEIDRWHDFESSVHEDLDPGLAFVRECLAAVPGAVLFQSVLMVAWESWAGSSGDSDLVNASARTVGQFISRAGVSGRIKKWNPATSKMEQARVGWAVK